MLTNLQPFLQLRKLLQLYVHSLTSKQASKHASMHTAVLLVGATLRLASIKLFPLHQLPSMVLPEMTVKVVTES